MATPLNYQEADLARQKAIAEQLRQQGMSGPQGAGYQGGQVYIVGNNWGNAASALAGALSNRDVSKKEKALDTQRKQEIAQYMTARPSMTNPDGSAKPYQQLQEEIANWQSQGVSSSNPHILKASLKGLEDYAEMPYKMETLRQTGDQKSALTQMKLDAASQALDTKIKDLQLRQQMDLGSKQNLQTERLLNQALLQMDKLQWERDKLNKTDETKRYGIDQNIDSREKINTANIGSREYIAELSADTKTEIAKLKQQQKELVGTEKHKKLMAETDASLIGLDNAIALVEQNPEAFGLKVAAAAKTGDLGEWGLNRASSPDQIKARAAVAALTAEEIHRLSGAAVTEAERPRLERFLPAGRDDDRVVLIKLRGMQQALRIIRETNAKGGVVEPGTFDRIADQVGLDSAMASDPPEQAGETVIAKPRDPKITPSQYEGLAPMPLEEQPAPAPVPVATAKRLKYDPASGGFK